MSAGEAEFRDELRRLWDHIRKSDAKHDNLERLVLDHTTVGRAFESIDPPATLQQYERLMRQCFACGLTIRPDDFDMPRVYQAAKLAEAGIETTLCRKCAHTAFMVGSKEVARLVRVCVALAISNDRVERK